MIRLILLLIPLQLNSLGITYEYPPPRVSFEQAYAYVRSWEGNYVHHINDRGGETYAGISRKYHPDWYGWRYVDRYPNVRHTFVPEAEFWVKDFYLTIWVREGYDKLTNQQVANYLFDTRIHISKKRTEQLLCGMGFDSWEDSYVWYNNQWHVISINNLSVEQLKLLRLRYYNRLVIKYPKNKTFIKGWTRRAEIG